MNHILSRAYAQTVKNSLDDAVTYHAITNTGASPVAKLTGLNTQHGMVDKVRRMAHVIHQFKSNETAAAPKRQIFFLTFGGWDHHNGLASAHPNHLDILDSMLGEFYALMAHHGLLNQVTLFTASDFGRALKPNGDGRCQDRRCQGANSNKLPRKKGGDEQVLTKGWLLDQLH